MLLFLNFILFLLAFLFFSNLFDHIIIVLILCFQICMLGNLIFILVTNKIKRKQELKKIEKIEKKEKEKFKYYRDILKEYTIGELGYLFNGPKNLNLLISADIENLKRKNCIKIIENRIEILDKTNLSKLEEYLIDKYKFLNESSFKKYYQEKLEASLKEKKCIQDFKKEVDPKLMLSWFLNFILFFILFNSSSVFGTQKVLLKSIEVFIGVFTIITLAISMVFVAETESNKYVKTEKGKEIYLKLCGLKNFLKDFNNFEEKNLIEISIWDEYILYAIILNESENLTQELQKDINEILEKLNKPNSLI